MARFDITQTNEAVRRLLEVTTNPRHRYLLAAYDRHRNLEMAGRYKEIFVSEMTIEHPVYHFSAFGINAVLDGRQQVETVYQQWTDSGQCVFYAGDEKLAVGDTMIASTATIYQQTPGELLVAAGADADPAATYLLAGLQHMIWPYDDRGRLIGEDVWEIDPSKRQVIKLDPADVLTPQQAAEKLEPLIKPLPSFPDGV